MRIENASITGCAGYGSWFLNCSNGYVGDLYLNTGADGVHLGGGCTNFVLKNIRGITRDDFTALIADEVAYRAELVTSGNISNVVIDGCYVDYSLGSPFEFCRINGSSGTSISNVTIRNIVGQLSAGHGITIADDTAAHYGGLLGATVNGIHIENVTLIPPAGYNVVYLGNPNIQDVTIRDMHLVSASGFGVGVSKPSSDPSNPAVAKLTISGVTTRAGLNSASVFYTDANATITQFIGNDWNVQLSDTGCAVNINGVVTNGKLSNSILARDDSGSGAPTCFIFANTSTGSTFDLSNVTMYNPSTTRHLYGVQCYGPTTSEWNGVNFFGCVNGGDIGVWMRNAACNYRILGSGCRIGLLGQTDEGNDNGTIFFQSSGTVTINNPSVPFRIDNVASLLGTPKKGDRYYNTRAASVTTPSPGPGVMKYNGTFWEPDFTPPAVAVTANATLNSYQNGGSFNNTGAAGAVTITLPTAVPGLYYHFARTAAQSLKVATNGTDYIALPGTPGTAATTSITCNATTTPVGNVTVECNVAGSWVIRDYAGTWTQP